LGPELVPAGVDEDRVAWLERGVLLLQRILEILDGDLVGVRQGLDAFKARYVDQHAPGHDLPPGVDAELGEAAPRRVLVHLEAVVPGVLVRLVREPVELRADLPDLRDDDLLVGAAPV